MSIILNIVLGVFIVIFISKLLKKTQNKISHAREGPDSNDVVKKIYKENGKCYKLIPKLFVCSPLS
jgi:hypothetical protein